MKRKEKEILAKIKQSKAHLASLEKNLAEEKAKKSLGPPPAKELAALLKKASELQSGFEVSRFRTKYGFDISFNIECEIRDEEALICAISFVSPVRKTSEVDAMINFINKEISPDCFEDLFIDEIYDNPKINDICNQVAGISEQLFSWEEKYNFSIGQDFFRKIKTGKLKKIKL